MAELTPERIYSLTEQATPLDGWAVGVSKSGETDKKLILSKHITYEEKVEIGTWNMASTSLISKTVTDVANIDRIEGVIIIDNDALEYNGNALYDGYIHKAKRVNGQSASKTVSVSGSTSGNSPGQTDAANISGNTTASSGGSAPSFVIEGSVPETPDSEGTITFLKNTYTGGNITCVKEPSPSIHYIINHNFGHTNYIISAISKGVINTNSRFLATYEKGANTVKLSFTETAYTDFKSTAFEFKIESTVYSDNSHFHGINYQNGTDHHHDHSLPHSHTFSGSGTTGTISPESGFAFKAVQVIAVLDRANSRVLLTHNACDNSQIVMTDFGEFTPASNASVMQKFTAAGNRGYIIIKRKFLAP